MANHASSDDARRRSNRWQGVTPDAEASSDELEELVEYGIGHLRALSSG